MALGDKINDARQKGISDDAILDYVARTQPEYTDRIRLAKNSGHASNSILDRMSQVYTEPHEQNPVREQIHNAINVGLASHKNAVEREEQGLLPTFMRGLQRSSIGRYAMEQEPEEERLHREKYHKPSLLEAATRGLGEYAGDIPAMTVGGGIGAPVGGVIGAGVGGIPGAAVGAALGTGAGAFALPEALKQIRDRYEVAKEEKKDLSWKDYLTMAYEGTANKEVVKHAALGATMGAVSPLVAGIARAGLLAPLLKNPKVAEKVINWSTIAGESGVLVADKAIEKGEIPTANDLADVASQYLMVKLAHGSANQLKKLYDISKPQLQQAIANAPRQTQANLVSPGINESKFNDALGEVVTAARTKIQDVRTEGTKKAIEHRTVGQQNIAAQQLPKKQHKIAERKLESQAKRIERTTERKAQALTQKIRNREAIAKQSGYLNYKEGEIDPLSKTPDKRVKIRYTPLKPDDIGKSNSEIIRQHRDVPIPFKKTKKAYEIFKEAVKHPIKSTHKVLSKIYTGVFDKANILNRISKETGHTELRKEYDKAKRAEALVEYELLYGEQDPATGRKISDESLAKMAKDSLPQDYGTKGKGIEELKDYLLGAASIDRTNLGQKNPVPTQAAEGIQRELPEFKPVAKKLWDFQDRYLQHALKEGLITPEGYKAMQEMYKAYIPLYRVQENSLMKIPGKGEATFNPIYGAKGSEKKHSDPLTNIVKNITSLNKARANNKFSNELRKSLEAMGYKATPANAPKIPGAAEAGNKRFADALENSGGWFAADAWTDGSHTIYGYRNGKRWKMEGVPKDVVNVIRAPGPAGKILRVFEGIRRRFSKGVTVYNPIGSTLIGLRDTMDAAVASKGPLGAATYYNQFLSAVGSVLKKDDRYQDFVKSGLYTHAYRGMSKVPFEETITDIFSAAKNKSNKELSDYALETLGAPMKVTRAIGKTLEAYSEGWSNASRLAWLEAEIKRPEYKGLSREKAYDKAYDKFNKDLIQFDRQGGWQTIQAFSRVIPFFNTTLQDVATLGRLLKTGGPMFYTNAAVSITLPALLSHLQVMEDDRYKRREDWEKERYFFFKPYFGLMDDGKQDLWKFPKPWSYGYLFGTTAEMFLDYIVAKDGEKSAWEAVQEWALGMGEEINPLSSVYGVKQIVPKKQERVAAEEQYTPNTTDFAKFFAQNIGTHLKPLPIIGNLASPLYVDAAINYLGSPLAKDLLHLTDELLFASNIKDNRRPQGRDFAAFFLKRLYASGQDLRSTYLNKFYKLAQLADERQTTYNTLRKRGEDKKADKLSDMGLYTTQKARKEISRIFQEADEIQHAPLSEISREEKDKQLRALAKDMDELAQFYVHELKDSGFK